MFKSVISNMTHKTYAKGCEYCRTMAKWDRTHEQEILDKAGKFCQSPHFLDFVASELDYLDHANLGPAEQLSYLVHVHDKTGCHCQDELIEAIEEKASGKES